MINNPKTLLNLTPHDIVILVGCDRNRIGEQVLIAPSGIVARVRLSRQIIDVINVKGIDIPITSPICHEITGLPKPSNNTYLIVSRMVAEHTKDRHDLVVPDKVVRNGANTKYCRAFSVPSAL